MMTVMKKIQMVIRSSTNRDSINILIAERYSSHHLVLAIIYQDIQGVREVLIFQLVIAIFL